MNDFERLQVALRRGELLHPLTGEPSLVDLARAIALLTGVEDISVTPPSERLAARIGATDHLVFIVADGLGMNVIEDLPRSRFLAQSLAGELRTVFPSSSSVALTSLATATWPADHAVMGQWTHIPEIGGSAGLLQFASRSRGKPLDSLGVDVTTAFPVRPTLRRVPREVLSLFPETLQGSVSSGYFADGRPRAGYRTLNEAIDITIDRIRLANKPTFTYIYTPRVDSEAHHHGVRHHATRSAVLEVDAAVERLAVELGGRGRVVLTADHGLVDTPVQHRHYIKPTLQLSELLDVPPSGDTRVTYLHVRPGAMDDTRAWLRSRFGDRFYVVTTDEADDLHLFGPDPVGPVARRRTGCMMVLSTGIDTLEYAPSGSIDRLTSVVSHHSGLMPDELRVPFVVA